MKLKLASNHHFNVEQVEKLTPLLGKEIDDEFWKTVKVAIAIVTSESTATEIAVDHPHAW